MFDDGDEKTVKRSNLVLKGTRHYNESEVSVFSILWTWWLEDNIMSHISKHLSCSMSPPFSADS